MKKSKFTRNAKKTAKYSNLIKNKNKQKIPMFSSLTKKKKMKKKK